VDESRAPFAKTTARKGIVEPALPPASPFPTPDEQPFRYDGPKPQFKESAIISLADGVEATSRSMPHTTAEAIQDVINRIVDERIADGQMDEAPLTLLEITRIKNSFQFTLLNMLHARIAYPPLEKPVAAAKG
jgi:membrane-associated HD superfamily phosphohydrolase